MSLRIPFTSSLPTSWSLSGWSLDGLDEDFHLLRPPWGLPGDSLTLQARFVASQRRLVSEDFQVGGAQRFDASGSDASDLMRSRGKGETQAHELLFLSWWGTLEQLEDVNLESGSVTWVDG